MKWSFVIQQKIKAALLLTSIMVLITLSTFISRSNIRTIDESFSSIYQDRLIPTIDIVYLSESLFNKRLLLERHLVSKGTTSPSQVSQQLHRHNQRIDSLITEFKKTYLIEEESQHLQALKIHLGDYAAQEKAILLLSASANDEAGQVLFNGKGADTFQLAIRQLNKLTEIQSIIGQALMKESKSESSQFNLISTLQITIAIIIGLLVLGLIHNATIIKQDSQPFHLN